MISQILIIEKDQHYFNLLSQICGKYKIDLVNIEDDVEDYINKNIVSLIISVIEENFFQEVSKIESLKNKEPYKNIPVIVIDKSPFPIPNNIKLAFQSGANDYLRDNVNELELESRIENQLKSSRRIQEVVVENSVAQETLELMDKLILFIDRADNSFLIFNKQGEIEWVNDGFTRMYGYTMDEFKRKFGGSLLEASSNKEITQKIERCAQSKKSISYVAECQTRTGEYIWIQTTLTPIVSPAGNLERFIAIESDITKQKETEEALNQKNEYMLAMTSHLQSANSLLEQQQNEINQKNNQLERAREKSDELLLNILPFEVARQLKSKGEAKPRHYRFTTVLFLDFIGFTKLTNELKPKELIGILDSYFKQFDHIVSNRYIEKIKTIGDAYMCVGGLPLMNKSNPLDVVMAGLEIQAFVNEKLNENRLESGLSWECRIGIHTGPVTAGVVGHKKYLYDIWGNTVNIAARMQQNGQAGKISISDTTYEYIKDYFDCDYQGKIKVKNAPDTDMYIVTGLKDEYAAFENTHEHNDKFQKVLNSL